MENHLATFHRLIVKLCLIVAALTPTIIALADERTDANRDRGVPEFLNEGQIYCIKFPPAYNLLRTVGNNQTVRCSGVSDGSTEANTSSPLQVVTTDAGCERTMK